MSTSIHIHLRVRDLAASRSFYESFLGSAPVKDEPGYVKFLPGHAPINLALTEAGDGASAGGNVGHLGIQVTTPDTVRAELARVQGAGLPVRVEMGVDCCLANQDKFWVQDPDGVDWEVYYLNHDLRPTRTTLQMADSCCPVAAPADGTGCCPS